MVAVPDVDEAARKAEALGGKIGYGPVDIPGGYGRIASLADPLSAAFAIHCHPGVPSFGGWHELYTDDAAAFDFYTGPFGWTKDIAHDMGEMGVYQTFAINGVPAGGVFKRPRHIPASCWN